MINASQEFKNFVKKGTKLVNYADITLKDGTVLNLGPSDFSVGGFSMTDKTSNGKFEIGTAIAKTISVTIANHTNKFSAYDFYKSIIYMYVAVEKEDGTVLKERKGKYYVINPTSPGDTIKLSGVDSMYLFDKPYNPKTFPATLQTILADCCIDCGVNIGFGEFGNWNFEVMNAPEECTYRQVVSWVAQIAGCHARINNNDYLELVWYDTSSLEKVNIDGGNYFVYENENIIDGGDFTTYESDLIIDGGNFTDYSPPNITKIKPPTVSTDNVVITGVKVEHDKKEVLLGTEDYLISVKDNPFVADKEDEVCKYLADKLIGLSFRPLSCQMVNNPLFEPFDSCYVYDRKGNVYFTLINSVTYTISGFTTLSCNAEDPIRNETSYVSEAAKAVVQARRESQAIADKAQMAAEKNAEAKAAELASEAASVAYEEAEKKAEAARLAEEAQRAAEEAAQLKAEAAKAEAIAEAAREAAELANQALEEAKRYSDENLTMYDRAVQNMNLLAANTMGLYRETEIKSDGSAIYYMSNRPITKSSSGVCSFETGSVVYKMTGDGFFVSEDGGKSYTSGFDSKGNSVVNVLSAIGITFDWAKGGTLSLGGENNVNGSLVVFDAKGKQVGKWDNSGIVLPPGTTISWTQVTDKDDVANVSQIPTNNNQLDNGAGYTTKIDVNSIITNKVTASFINALKVTAGSVAAENITGTTIKGKIIEGGTVKGSSIEGGTIKIGSQFSVNSDGEVEANSLKTNSIEITGGEIQIGKYFSVDSLGNVVANSFTSNNATITGGSINITTSASGTSAITLKYSTSTMSLAPSEIRFDYLSNHSYMNAVGVTTDNIKAYGNEITIGSSTKFIGAVTLAIGYTHKIQGSLQCSGAADFTGTFETTGSSIIAGASKMLGFFGSNGGVKRTVSVITSTSTATTNTIATKVNDLINALKTYNLI